MTVESGEVFGFLGPNGAGKTTTMRMLLDLLHPTSGAATVFGLDSRRDSRAIRARLGSLPGDFAYDPRLTGHDLLSFLADVRGIRGLGRAPELAERQPASSLIWWPLRTTSARMARAEPGSRNARRERVRSDKRVDASGSRALCSGSVAEEPSTAPSGATPRPRRRRSRGGHFLRVA